ncbi:MAG: hypothetical protein LBQ76_08750 [Candidatus Fibromonas sp.]|jgi:hypothetical protein|nr:hypothetical protein [Candidatus Fibromonas sp.]
MKKSRSVLISAIFSVALTGGAFLGCSGETEILPPCDDIEGLCPPNGSTNSSSSDDYEEPWEPGEPEVSSASTPDSSPSEGPSSNSDNPISSGGGNPNPSSSSPNTNPSSGGTAPVSSSSVRASSSSVPATVGNNCAYHTSLCGGIAFEDIITRSLNNWNDEGPTCIYATSIGQLGNENGQGGGLRVNGVELKGNYDSQVGGRCGKTDWGQLPCAEAISNARVQKIDNGYYIYAPGWAGDVTTTGSTPNCSGGNPQPSSSSRPSSSSVSGTGPTLTCASVPTTGTAGIAITAPVVRCNNSTVTGNSLTWTGAPNWNTPTAGTYNNVRASVNSGTCNGLQATCAGTLVVSPQTTPPTPSSSSQGGNSNIDYPDFNGQTGRTTRYWDACKPSCAWTGNSGGSPNGTCKSCGVSGSKLSDANARNACESGPAYTCMDQAPWEVNANVSYGFAASHTNSDCGKCYQLRFTSGPVNGKTLIVMISNIGGDVGQTQFDLMIPGGGVGQFNALSTQLSQNGGGTNLGQTYGGFRATCGDNASCVQNMCNEAFKGSALADLKRGCDWYVNWFKIADNPSVKYQQINCPQELISKYR